ncbi:hypothetical protein [Chitinophaga sp.]|uniref:hypothetical protein n=1 Tax=Chitinophaga sp. TaxID=1869181 RepID=UPI0031D33059
MRYSDFETVMSPHRMARYLNATGGDTKKAMTLYRLNLRASQELFTIISCFEVALRNAIDSHYLPIWGNNWLRDAARTGGVLTNPKCGKTPDIVNNAVEKLKRNYSHPALIAEMDFGFWRYMFARHQFSAFRKTLLAIFPAKPVSSPAVSYDSNFVFTGLEKINGIRNRIAHHEPICFQNGAAACNTAYARQHYQLILNLFTWLGIDECALLYGLDHITDILERIDHI